MRNYWLMRSEPAGYSIGDAPAARHVTVPWTGVRNAMRDAMQEDDGMLFYHSGCAEPGLVGIAWVA